jgi:hypothetical protein
MDSQHFLGMPKYMAYGGSHAVTTSSLTPGIPLNKWLPQYMKMLYILARSYQPKTPQDINALKTFIVSLAQLLPDAYCRQYMMDYIKLKPYVVQQLTSHLPNIFIAYPWLEQEMKLNPANFFNMSLQNQDGQALFLWVYLLNGLFFINSNQIQYLSSIQEMRLMYQLDKITKQDWGNSFWYMLHTSALYAPEPCDISFNNYQNLLASLQYLLPCPKCCEHLKQNLQHIDMVYCPKNNIELFKCSWKLHNIVNKSERKPEMGLQKALSLYTY